MRVTPFQPNAFATAGVGGTRPRDIQTVLGLLAGAASVCWENPAGAGEFKSEQASAFVDQAHALIDDMIATAVAGMLTQLRLPYELNSTPDEVKP